MNNGNQGIPIILNEARYQSVLMPGFFMAWAEEGREQ